MTISAKTKYLILFTSIALIVVIVAIYLIFSGSENYLILETSYNNHNLEGSLVMSQNIVIGQVIYGEIKYLGRHLYKIKLQKSVHIPAKSRAFYQEGENNKIIRIEFVPSQTYLSPGDTLTLEGSLKNDSVQTQIPENGTVTFRVQIYASTEKRTDHPAHIKNLPGLKTSHEDGWYKYYVGETADYEEALKKKQEMMKAGFNDAFITAYLNNKRISVQEAIRLKE